MLSRGELVCKVASDFIGDVIGATQTKTRQILDSGEGKVVLIDEVYGLNDQQYGKDALNTIVEKVLGAARRLF